MAIRNFTSILHIFLDSYELKVQRKENCLGKTVMEIWSQVGGKITMLVHKVTFKKSAKKKRIKLKNLKALF